MTVVIPIFLWLVGLFVLYLVIRAAVRDAINQSVIGVHFARKNREAAKKSKFLSDDLDSGN